MAENDDTKVGEGEEGEARGGKPRGGGRSGRGERNAGRGGAPSSRDVRTAAVDIANMDPKQAAAIISALQARASAVGASSTPKLSTTLDELDAEEADSVIEACDDVLETMEELESAPVARDPVTAQAQRKDRASKAAEAAKQLSDVSPAVYSAIVTNSAYRQKPLSHSVRVTRDYLVAKHGDDAEPDRPEA